MKQKVNKALKKGLVPIKYIFSSGISFIIDQGIFSFLLLFFSNNIFIIFCKLVARAISSFINFILNSKIVFMKSNDTALLKYYILVVSQAVISAVSIYILKTIFLNTYTLIISVCVDVVLFVVNYFVQKEWIFK